jgi:cysteinyl-tRNA synthetase
MAKSLGNFVLVKDLLKQYSGNDIRWFMYQSRYQNPLSYSEKLFAQSSNELWKLLEQINQGYVQAYLHKFKLINSVGVPEKDFIATLNNDLEFPNVKTIILKQVKNLANFVRAKKFDKFQKLLATIKGEFNILGIVYNNPLDNQEIKSLVDEWQKSLQQKNYLLADKYRQQLIDKKVI